MGLNTNRFVVILCHGPNANATAVHAKQITLYGILKSGVGRLMRIVSVRI